MTEWKDERMKDRKHERMEEWIGGRTSARMNAWKNGSLEERGSVRTCECDTGRMWEWEIPAFLGREGKSGEGGMEREIRGLRRHGG